MGLSPFELGFGLELVSGLASGLGMGLAFSLIDGEPWPLKDEVLIVEVVVVDVVVVVAVLVVVVVVEVDIVVAVDVAIIVDVVGAACLLLLLFLLGERGLLLDIGELRGLEPNFLDLTVDDGLVVVEEPLHGPGVLSTWDQPREELARS